MNETVNCVEDDFSGLPQQLEFTESGKQCFNVTIIMDSYLEDPEYFYLVLATRDEDVNFEIRTAEVNIIDSNSKLYIVILFYM